jgi:hypothetical protein
VRSTPQPPRCLPRPLRSIGQLHPLIKPRRLLQHPTPLVALATLGDEELAEIGVGVGDILGGLHIDRKLQALALAPGCRYTDRQ